MRAIDADELKTAFPCGEYIRTESVRATIDNMPTVEPERKKGKWEVIDSADGGTDFRCSSCHRYRFHNGEMRKKYKYCPNCGADMKEGDSE